MAGSPRPIGARCGLTAVLAAAALVGCASTASAHFGGGITSVAPGTSVGGATVGVHIESGSAAAARIGVGFLSVTVYGAEEPPTRVPKLDPRRSVNAQDCSQPIANPSANLKCE
ncbi:MAG: hypothetical protein M0015_11860 [Betaproteobacteria bacterium]|nr:hypothetical protein [Betaproteobacteria bacterium]